MKLKQRLGIGFFVLVVSFSGYLVLEATLFAPKMLTIEVVFPNLEGIRHYSKVKINGGYTIGYVERIDQNEESQVMVLRLNGDIQIPKKGIQFSVYTTGFMGSKYINVFTIGQEGPYIEQWDRFYGVPPGNLNQSLIYFTQMLNEEPPADEQNFAKLVVGARESVNGLNKKLANLGPEITGGIQSTKVGLQDGVAALEKAVIFLEANTKGFGQLDKLTKQRLQTSLNTTFALAQKINIVLAKGAENRSKVVGKILFEETQYEEMRQMTEYFSKLMDSYQQNPYTIFNEE